MRCLVAAALVLISCGAPIDPPRCTTKCGLSYQGRVQTKESDYNCADIQGVEDRTVAAISPQYPNACQALRNWDLWNHADPTWTDYYQRSVGGLTSCRNFQSEIGLAESIDKTALAHELVHMVQGCYGGVAPFDPGMDAAHGDWVRRGLFALIDQVNAP